MPFVLDVENRLLKSYTYNHEYVMFWGLDVFNELVPRLILGENSPALNSGRVSVSLSKIHYANSLLTVRKHLTIIRSRIFSAVKMEATRSSETSVLTRSTRCHIPEDSILYG
jgi:hypothetical protein